MKNHKKPIQFISLFALIFFFINTIFCQTSLKAIGLNSGEYNVGFKHYQTVDSTRTYKRIFDWNNKSMFRPIPISIWYPSIKPNSLEPMRVLDYMEILKEEEEWEYLPNEQILNWFYYANTPSNQAHLLETTKAYSEIEPIKGKYPVVIYAPGQELSSIENFALCEFLASYGYIVISSPSRGTDHRFFQNVEKGMETQARDIEFLIKEAMTLPNADLDQMATMGFSFGGLSNVLVQMRNDKIKAIVSLDGAIKYQYATLKKSPFFNIEKVVVPFIHMSQKDIPEEVLKDDKIDASLNDNFEFYDSLTKSQAYQLKFENLTHSYFSTLGVLFQQRDKRQDKSDVEIMASYRLVSTYALNFLNAFIKNDEEALQFIEIDSVNNGIKSGLVLKKSKEPTKDDFTFQDFNELASKQKYKNLDALYKSILKRHPKTKLPQGNLNNLGLQLIFNPETSEQGINVFLLATSIYPNSANLFDSLAEAYLYIDNKEKARFNFEKSLQLNPENQNAIDRLKQLGE